MPFGARRGRAWCHEKQERHVGAAGFTTTPVDWKRSAGPVPSSGCDARPPTTWCRHADTKTKSWCGDTSRNQRFDSRAVHADGSRDILGRVYEYFLGGFAGAEGKRGGEFYTPRSVVRLLVAMLEPYRGRVYDPCCGSGGMFVQSERFVEEHGGRIGDIAIYGQESNYTTWRLARMNLAVRGIDADIRWNNEGSFHKDELPDLRADFILANPPFNV